MENQHKMIKGYRDLSADEIEMMNVAKMSAAAVGEIVDTFAKHPEVDQRWLAIARTDLQKGFMALVRSVAKPESF